MEISCTVHVQDVRNSSIKFIDLKIKSMSTVSSYSMLLIFHWTLKDSTVLHTQRDLPAAVDRCYLVCIDVRGTVLCV